MSSAAGAYDIAVVGGGHAGSEAALAAARMGCRVLLLSMNWDTVASMPCSPSIGGVAKGQIVRDLDALGGAMARVTDRTAIQYRTLNTSKGPAVQSTRTQNDKWRYHHAMRSVLERQEHLDVRQVLVEDLIIDDSRVTGVVDHTGTYYAASRVVLATGTFLAGRVHIGRHSHPAGRAGEFAADGLSRRLHSLGFTLGRMKTGTPARLHRRSIDFSAFTEQWGDETPRPFSLFTKTIPLRQVCCYQGATTERAHDVVRRNLERSSLYGGGITGAPARYCPSFEDKVVRFADRPSHPLILEPEGLDSEEIYLSGLGNSLPLDIQHELVHSIGGLEEAEIIRPAYAIEYDFVNPIQLHATLETRRVAGLYLAGQVNGTSGYEEAAGQGFWAGVNAACAVQGRPPFLPDRSQTYLAVMVDDLVTQGTDEPYRMFTSRAEYRLLLREDNADERLMPLGHELGLVDSDALHDMQQRYRAIHTETARLRETTVSPSAEVNQHLEKLGTTVLRSGTTMAQLLKRPGISYREVADLTPGAPSLPPADCRRIEVAIKYQGFIERQLREVEQFHDLERTPLPDGFDYDAVPGLSNELKGKLAAVRPVSLGQASRVAGMTPAAVASLLLVLKRPAPKHPDPQPTEER